MVNRFKINIQNLKVVCISNNQLENMIGKKISCITETKYIKQITIIFIISYMVPYIKKNTKFFLWDTEYWNKQGDILLNVVNNCGNDVNSLQINRFNVLPINFQKILEHI